MSDQDPRVFWPIFVTACLVTGGLWVLAWYQSPWPIVGWITGGFIMSIPLWVGIATVVKRK